MFFFSKLYSIIQKDMKEKKAFFNQIICIISTKTKTFENKLNDPRILGVRLIREKTLEHTTVNLFESF
jgi:hypothetical protein